MSEDQDEELGGLFKEVFLTNGPSLVVCDEAHIIKNDAAKISKELGKLTCPRRICLTGYPLQNNLKEYWCMVGGTLIIITFIIIIVYFWRRLNPLSLLRQMNFVYPGYLGSYSSFKTSYEIPIEKGMSQDAETDEILSSSVKLKKLHIKLGKIIHRKGPEVLEKLLPAKHEFVITCRPTDLQRKVYQAFIKETSTVLFASLVSSLVTLHPVLLKKSRDLCTKNRANKKKKKEEETENQEETLVADPTEYDRLVTTMALLEEHEKTDNSKSLEYSPKMCLLFEIIKKCKELGEKLLVFSKHIPSLDYVEEVLANSYPHIEKLRFDGNDQVKKRTANVDTFQKDPDYTVFLISTVAGGLGINLTSATRAVLLDINWNPCLDEQALARLYRFGQTKPVYVYRFLLYGTFDEVVYNVNIKKQGLSK